MGPVPYAHWKKKLGLGPHLRPCCKIVGCTFWTQPAIGSPLLVDGTGTTILHWMTCAGSYVYLVEARKKAMTDRKRTFDQVARAERKKSLGKWGANPFGCRGDREAIGSEDEWEGEEEDKDDDLEMAEDDVARHDLKDDQGYLTEYLYGKY